MRVVGEGLKAAKQAHEADKVIESFLKAIFLFEYFVSSFVSLCQPFVVDEDAEHSQEEMRYYVLG